MVNFFSEALSYMKTDLGIIIIVVLFVILVIIITLLQRKKLKNIFLDNEKTEIRIKGKSNSISIENTAKRNKNSKINIEF